DAVAVAIEDVGGGAAVRASAAYPARQREHRDQTLHGSASAPQYGGAGTEGKGLARAQAGPSCTRRPPASCATRPPSLSATRGSCVTATSASPVARSSLSKRSSSSA